MNMVLHGVVDFKVEYGDLLGNPKLVDGSKLKTYDKVVVQNILTFFLDKKLKELLFLLLLRLSADFLYLLMVFHFSYIVLFHPPCY
jgi:hypothetical protein